jgi:hypothetical protein
MRGYLHLANVIYWLGLILWIAALISAAVAAMNVFPALKAMPIELADYANYPSDQHWRFAAGQIMEGVFFLIDVMQFVAAPLVLITLIAQLAVFRMPLRSISNLARAACIAVAAGLFAYHATMLAPKMNRALREQWEAAKAGEIERADALRAAFNADHQTADAILKLNLILLIVTAGASAVALGPALQSSTDLLEPPALLRHS